MENEEINKYDNETFDADEVDGVDIKINPEFYIHQAILKAQNALANPIIKDGFLQFQIIVEHVESLARASKFISDTYQEDVTTFKKNSTEYTTQTDKLAQSVILANKKLELLLAEIFSNKTLVSTLRIGTAH